MSKENIEKWLIRLGIIGLVFLTQVPFTEVFNKIGEYVKNNWDNFFGTWNFTVFCITMIHTYTPLDIILNKLKKYVSPFIFGVCYSLMIILLFISAYLFSIFPGIETFYNTCNFYWVCILFMFNIFIGMVSFLYAMDDLEKGDYTLRSLIYAVLLGSLAMTLNSLMFFNV